jgi:phosphoglycerate dehydrogenase-like enzyme
MADLVLDLNDRRPVWALPDWAVEEVRSAVPRDWEVHAASTPADGSGDGTGGPSDEVLKAVRGARVYVGFGIPPGILAVGRGTLEWVHTGTAGVGGSLHDAMRTSGVRFTNAAGIHGPPMAETVLAAILHFFRGLDFAVRGQGRGRWESRDFFRGDTPVRELGGATVGILGYGGIGREIARRLAPLDVRVLGLRRTPPLEEVDDLGTVLLHGEEGLSRLLAESEALVVAAPETPDTRGVLTRERLSALRPDAVLVNVSRGGLVDEDALVDVLREERIRGAALDVFRSEPLPAGHPLWSLPNVLITPHVSAVSRGFWRRHNDLFLENLGRFLRGEPLRNQVDLEAGY